MNDQDWVGVPVPNQGTHAFTHRLLTKLEIPISVLVPDETIMTEHPYVIRSMVVRATHAALNNYDTSALEDEQLDDLETLRAQLFEEADKCIFTEPVKS